MDMALPVRIFFRNMKFKVLQKSMNKLVSCLVLLLVLTTLHTHAQVNAVEFGKNRVQHEKFKWKYYQTQNFNTYFSQDGLGLGKYVAQIAEQELPGIEQFVEYGLQRRTNVVVFNNFDDYQQSNIGLDIEWQSPGGVTKLVNNKMLVYFDGNHDNLRKQIREGIAQILVANILFGDDLGEFAANQALLDLPKWLTDGYIQYAAENWSPALDDQLRSVMLSAEYRNFYQFAFDKPALAGHAFWKYIADKYGKNKVTYFLYLARIYRNLNNASNKLAKKKFKAILQDLMLEVPQQYYKDLRGRKNVPKGQLAFTEEVGKKDFIRFNANPTPRSFSYALVEYKQGVYKVVLIENYVNKKVLLKYGSKSVDHELNPNYPILAWDGKGTRLACVYTEKGKVKLFVYDVVNRIKTTKGIELPFDQVQDVKYMLDNNTLIFSAVRSGQTDIYTYKIKTETIDQITNDVYDDLDPSFVAFPNKTGIIYSSNRPSALAASSEDSLPVNRFNIFMVDNWNKSDFKQISQLTAIQRGNARFPSQYNTTHFTFVSDENGVNNRYAGFFKTERAGLDTLVFIGDEVLRNPTIEIVDSVLKDWEKPDVDSIGFVSVTNDSSYVFPLTNYQSSLLETRTAGDNQQVSEVIKMGDLKMLYRLRIDENLLRRRNVNAKPTEYIRQLIDEERRASGRKATPTAPTPGGRDTSGVKPGNYFQNEFGNERPPATTPTAVNGITIKSIIEEQQPAREPVLRSAKLYEYCPLKFFADYAVTGITSTVYGVTKYQPYGGGAGPIFLSNGSGINGLIRMGTSDLMEDIKITGGVRIAPNLKDNDLLMEFMNLRRRIDWGANFFRSSNTVSLSDNSGNPTIYSGRAISTYYLAKFKLPFDRVRSLRATIGPRIDRLAILARDLPSLQAKDVTTTYGQINLEYVHDNTVTKSNNILNGLRYKAFFDFFTQLNKGDNVTKRQNVFNAGFDARYYYPIYRNLIWAVRGSGDFSWGDQKVIYYMGGADNWLWPKFYKDNRTNRSGTQNYLYQSLTNPVRGFNQNIANGNNAVVINSEIRLPIFSTLFNRPINNAMLRNFQLVQFFDLGTAWEGSLKNIERPVTTIDPQPTDPNDPLLIRYKAGGLGPFAGGYGFGARTTLLGYFLRVDAAWEMNGFFHTKPKWYFGIGFDF
jgi:hypothetical protein